MASAWKDTPTKWYPIPIALGAAVLLAVQYRKTRSTSPQVSSVGDRIEVTGDGEHGAAVQVKSSGPWQVRVLGALPLRSLSQLWGYLNGLVLPVWFRPFGFKLYARIFGCNLEECEEQDLTQYKSLGEFFYRTLKPGLRPVDTSAEVVSPNRRDGAWCLDADAPGTGQSRRWPGAAFRRDQRRARGTGQGHDVFAQCLARRFGIIRQSAGSTRVCQSAGQDGRW